MFPILSVVAAVIVTIAWLAVELRDSKKWPRLFTGSLFLACIVLTFVEVNTRHGIGNLKGKAMLRSYLVEAMVYLDEGRVTTVSAALERLVNSLMSAPTLYDGLRDYETITMIESEEGAEKMDSNQLALLATVAILEDMQAHRIQRGQVGTIVEVLNENTYEVEFSDDSGATIAPVPVHRVQLLPLRYDASGSDSVDE